MGVHRSPATAGGCWRTIKADVPVFWRTKPFLLVLHYTSESIGDSLKAQPDAISIIATTTGIEKVPEKVPRLERIQVVRGREKL